MTAAFDLDFTLIEGDSTTLWCEWLGENGWIEDVPAFLAQEAKLMQDYREKQLNVGDYVELALNPVIHLPITEITALVEQFIQDKINPIIIPVTFNRLKEHQKSGDVIILSSSPHFLVESIAKQCFKIQHSFGIATEEKNGYYALNLKGISPYQGGKLTLFQEFMNDSSDFFAGCYFYTDSINDIALLNAVEFPCVINPDNELEQIAEDRGWERLE